MLGAVCGYRTTSSDYYLSAQVKMKPTEIKFEACQRFDASVFWDQCLSFFASHDKTRKAKFDVLYAQFILPVSFESSGRAAPDQETLPSRRDP